MATNSVLIVDDDPDLCHLLGGILRNRNLQVGIASNLNAAEACISEMNPFIIFLDHNLPDGAGIDFIAQIAEMDPDIQVVLMTADSTPGIEVKAFEKGADHFLVKPFTYAIINGIIDMVLSERA